MTDQERASRVEDIAAADAEVCHSSGFKTGSPEYAHCRMLLDQQRRTNNAAVTGIVLNNTLIEHY
jgi:hypothetical protein